jgi:hypothetical protein
MPSIYMRKAVFLAALFLNGITLFAQTSDEQILKIIYKSSLINSKCYSWLDYLSNLHLSSIIRFR